MHVWLSVFLGVSCIADLHAWDWNWASAWQPFHMYRGQELSYPSPDFNTSLRLTASAPYVQCNLAKGRKGNCVPVNECTHAKNFSHRRFCGSTRQSVCCPVQRVAAPPAHCELPSGDQGSCLPKSQCRTADTASLPSCHDARSFCCPLKRECEKFAEKYRQEENEICDGRSAVRREFPHIVALGYQAGNGIEYGCSGTLLTRRHILTAADCIVKEGLSTVRVGASDLRNKNEGRVYLVESAVINGNYSGHMENDIGVVRTATDMEFSAVAHPPCLHTTMGALPKGSLTIGGWSGHGVLHKSLHTAPLRLAKLMSCGLQLNHLSTRFRPRFKMTSKYICASAAESNVVNACHGDPGSPLQYQERGVQFVVGIVSQGSSCPSSVDLYTRVSPYLQWISNQTKDTSVS